MEELDIKQTGPVGLLGLKGINTVLAPDFENMTDEEFLLVLNSMLLPTKKQALLEGALSMSESFDITSGHDIGKSMWDLSVYSLGLIDLAQDIRAENQPGIVQLGAGAVKALSTAVTSSVSGLANFAYGLGYLGSFGLAYDFNEVWNNPISLLMQEADDYMNNEVAPVYTPEGYENKNWVTKMGDAAFWSEQLANAGFMLGAAYSGTGFTAALGKLGLFATVMAEANKGRKILLGLTKALAASANSSTTAKILGGFFSALGEAGIEAILTYKTALENRERDIDASYQKYYQDILAQVEGGRMSVELAQIALLLAQENTAALKELAKQDALLAGNSDFALNMMILGPLNAFLFDRLFSSGFNSALKTKLKELGTTIAKEAVEGDLKGIVKPIEKTYEGVKKSKLRALTIPLSEGAEEMNLLWAASGSEALYSPDSPDAYYLALRNNLSKVETMLALDALGKGLSESWGSFQQYELFFGGAVMSLLGVPTIGRSQNSGVGTYLGSGKSFGMTGGIFGEMAAINEENRRSEKAALGMNLFIKDYNLVIGTFVQGKSFTELMNRAVENKDKFEYLNELDNLLWNAILSFSAGGRLEELKTIIGAEFSQSLANLEELAKATSQKDANGKYSGPFAQEDGTLMSDTEEGQKKMISTLEENKKKILDNIDLINSRREAIDALTYNRLTDDLLNELTWLSWKIDKYKERRDSIVENNKQFFEDLTTTYSAAIKELLEGINKLQEIIDSETANKATKDAAKDKKKKLTEQYDNLINFNLVIDYLVHGAIRFKGLTMGYDESGRQDIKKAINKEGFIEDLIKDASLLASKTAQSTNNSYNPVEIKLAMLDLTDLSRLQILEDRFGERLEAFLQDPSKIQLNRDKIDNLVATLELQLQLQQVSLSLSGALNVHLVRTVVLLLRTRLPWEAIETQLNNIPNPEVQLYKRIEEERQKALKNVPFRTVPLMVNPVEEAINSYFDSITSPEELEPDLFALYLDQYILLLEPTPLMPDFNEMVAKEALNAFNKYLEEALRAAGLYVNPSPPTPLMPLVPTPLMPIMPTMPLLAPPQLLPPLPAPQVSPTPTPPTMPEPNPIGKLGVVPTPPLVIPSPADDTIAGQLQKKEITITNLGLTPTNAESNPLPLPSVPLPEPPIEITESVFRGTTTTLYRLYTPNPTENPFDGRGYSDIMQRKIAVVQRVVEYDFVNNGGIAANLRPDNGIYLVSKDSINKEVDSTGATKVIFVAIKDQEGNEHIIGDLPTELEEDEALFDSSPIFKLMIDSIPDNSDWIDNGAFGKFEIDNIYHGITPTVLEDSTASTIVLGKENQVEVAYIGRGRIIFSGGIEQKDVRLPKGPTAPGLVYLLVNDISGKKVMIHCNTKNFNSQEDTIVGRLVKDTIKSLFTATTFSKVMEHIRALNDLLYLKRYVDGEEKSIFYINPILRYLTPSGKELYLHINATTPLINDATSTPIINTNPVVWFERNREGVEERHEGFTSSIRVGRAVWQAPLIDESLPVELQVEILTESFLLFLSELHIPMKMLDIDTLEGKQAALQIMRTNIAAGKTSTVNGFFTIKHTPSLQLLHYDGEVTLEVTTKDGITTTKFTRYRLTKSGEIKPITKGTAGLTIDKSTINLSLAPEQTLTLFEEAIEVLLVTLREASGQFAGDVRVKVKENDGTTLWVDQTIKFTLNPLLQTTQLPLVLLQLPQLLEPQLPEPEEPQLESIKDRVLALYDNGTPTTTLNDKEYIHDTVSDLWLIVKDGKVTTRYALSNSTFEKRLLLQAQLLKAALVLSPQETVEEEISTPTLDEEINASYEVDTEEEIDLEEEATEELTKEPVYSNEKEIQREHNWMTKTYPLLDGKVALLIIENIRELGKSASGLLVFGRFKRGLIQVFKEAPMGTGFHEAFHAITRMVLSKGEILNMFNLARDKYKTDNEIALEEKLASDFRKYMIWDLMPVIGGLVRTFRTLKNTIKTLIGTSGDIDMLFYNIARGKVGYGTINYDSYLQAVRDYQRELNKWDNLELSVRNNIAARGITKEDWEKIPLQLQESFKACASV